MIRSPQSSLFSSSFGRKSSEAILRCSRNLARPRRRPTVTTSSATTSTHHPHRLSSSLMKKTNKKQRNMNQQGMRAEKSTLEGILNQRVPHQELAQSFEISRLAKKTGVRLTGPEIDLLRRKLGCKGDGVASFQEFKRLGSEAKEKQWSRELLLNAVEQPSTTMDKFASKLVFSLDFLGKGLFAVVGAQAAGDAGMNIVGATLIGCVASMGGGTLNNLLYGHSMLDTQTGVRWVRNPNVLFSAVLCSIITFFVWPVYCREQAKKELRQVFGSNLQEDGSADKSAFVNACNTNSNFRHSIAKGLGPAGKKFKDDPEKLFELADDDESGSLELDEMQKIVGKRVSGSDVIFGLDTVAFASLSVFGVHQATTRGLNPFVACTSGVTICFGGIFRDVLCGKDIAACGQSYAFATWMGSTAYVAMRELAIQGIPIPLIARIICSFLTVVGVRTLEYVKGEPLLRPMHYHDNPKKFFVNDDYFEEEDDDDDEDDDDEEAYDPVVRLVRHVTKLQQISRR